MNPLRLVGLLLGLASAAVILVGRSVVARSVTSYLDGTLQVATVDAVPAADVAVSPTTAHGRWSAVVVARAVLGGIGVVVLLVGVWKVLHAVHPENYLWLVLWLAAAVVLHDGVLDPLLVLLRSASVRGLRRLPDAAVAVIRGGFVLAGLLVLVVVPEIYAQHLSPLNPTILPGSYAARLVASLVVIAVFTAAAAVLLILRARNQPRARTRSVELAQR